MLDRVQPVGFSSCHSVLAGCASVSIDYTPLWSENRAVPLSVNASRAIIPSLSCCTDEGRSYR